MFWVVESSESFNCTQITEWDTENPGRLLDRLEPDEEPVLQKIIAFYEERKKKANKKVQERKALVEALHDQRGLPYQRQKFLRGLQ